jgi:hypothetical protein
MCMYVYICMCISFFMYICMCILINMYAFVYLNMHIKYQWIKKRINSKERGRIYVRAYIYAYTWIHIRMYVSICMYTWIHIYIYIYMCMYVCMYTFIYIYMKHLWIMKRINSKEICRIYVRAYIGYIYVHVHIFTYVYL